MERHQQAYKGYLITQNIVRGEYYVTKDGHHITTVSTYEAATAAIDLLV